MTKDHARRSVLRGGPPARLSRAVTLVLAAGVVVVGCTIAVAAPSAAAEQYVPMPLNHDSQGFDPPAYSTGAFGASLVDDVDGVGGWFENQPADTTGLGIVDIQSSVAYSGSQAARIHAAPGMDNKPALGRAVAHNAGVTPTVTVESQVRIDGGGLPHIQWTAQASWGYDSAGNQVFLGQLAKYGWKWCLGASTNANCANFTPGQWYHIRLVHDFDAQTMTAFVDGVELVTAPFRQTGAVSMAFVAAGVAGIPAAHASTMYVDDVRISGATLEAGSVDVDGVNPTTVTLDGVYTDPVVVVTPRRQPDTPPVAARVDNVAGGSFDAVSAGPLATDDITGGSFDVDLAAIGSGPATATTVDYIVVEAGTWNVDGVPFEAVSYTSTLTDRRNNWVGQQRTYAQTYTSPVVVGQVMSSNDPDFSLFWARGAQRSDPPSGSALWTGKHVGEDPDTVRADETIGYVVFDSGHHVINDVDIEAGVGADSVRGTDNDPPYSYTFQEPFATTPVVVAASAAMDGNDGGHPVTYSASPAGTTTVDLAIAEDQLRDTEQRHTTEQVAYVAVG